MTTFTSIVASVVVNSSAVALSHFGLNVEPLRLEKPAPVPERVVVRSRPQPQKVVNAAGDPQPKPLLNKA